MSLTHCIRTLLDLKDKNISFPENYCEERVIKGRKTKLIYATLTYKPVCCTRCGCLNTQFSIVKNGFLTSNIKWISTTRFPTYLLSLNSTLKATYTCYQDLLYAMSQNNSDLLKFVLSSPHEQVSDYMSTALQTLRKHEERIRNTFQSKRSNGPLEGSINKIKVIKRTAYGYTSFLNYKYRILISFQEKEKTI